MEVPSHLRRLGTISSHLCSESLLNISTAKQHRTSSILDPIRVLITGSAGNIGYALAFGIAEGNAFGPHQPVILHLLEIEPAKKALEGVKMELDDGAFPLLVGIVATTDPVTAFKDVNVIVMVGAFPRQKGMERKDLLERNASIFRQQGSLIEQYASRKVKILVVGNPANTNCLIASRFAPSIPSDQWSCLTRLDQNRAITQISTRLGVSAGNVKNIIIWGNHSSTQYPDCASAFAVSPTGDVNSVTSLFDETYLRGEFVETVQKRGAAVIATRGASSAQSAARAIVCHLRDWFLGTPRGEYVSMGIISDGSYGVPRGLVFSFPVTVDSDSGRYSIVQGLPLDDFAKEKIRITTQELLEERDQVFKFLKI
eukprot:TRINITY_DN2177_c0_g1_i6.p1 TRINITY_DN2177_c0_g1~~TRINITY_DN2177_c0_g1_i6.p1  ORF type:complete len:370 (-),score=60.09 TRINITY_DN2177_c0_g1_i6:102-1211(-)